VAPKKFKTSETAFGKAVPKRVFHQPCDWWQRSNGEIRLEWIWFLA
jgi:hypothetical protein